MGKGEHSVLQELVTSVKKEGPAQVGILKKTEISTSSCLLEQIEKENNRVAWGKGSTQNMERMTGTGSTCAGGRPILPGEVDLHVIQLGKWGGGGGGRLRKERIKWQGEKWSTL